MSSNPSLGLSDKIKNKIPRRIAKLYLWIRGGSERTAVALILGVTFIFCLLLLFLPPPSVGGGHDDHHGHGGGEEHENEAAAIELEDDVLEAAGMTLEEAGAKEIHPQIMVRGHIAENGNRSMNVRPRFGGIAVNVYKDFGDQVKKGDTLMLIESATTRSAYTIRTAIDGIVADKRVVLGAFVPENESVFRIVDLSSVWFQARVPIRDADRLKIGLTASVQDRRLDVKAEGKLIYVSPAVDEDTQACDIRIQLENPSSGWRVGSFADADIQLDPMAVDVAVKSSAIQVLNGQNVVFRRDEDRLIAVPVVIGWSDKEWSEIREGIKAGDTYLSANSFIAKAELLKSTAEHEH